MTFNDLEVILYFMKNLPLHNFRIHRNFYENRFINEYAIKKKDKISESRSLLVIYKITYVPKNSLKYRQKNDNS